MHLEGRNFRFSVASNHVGHYIYGLKDRIWPYFIYHFHLYKPEAWSFSMDDLFWHCDKEIFEIAARTPIAVKTKLDFLKHSAIGDSSSSKELAKFGLSRHKDIASQKDDTPSPESSPENANPSALSSPVEANLGKLKFGNFPAPEIMEISNTADLCLGSFKASVYHSDISRPFRFLGRNFQHDSWDSISRFILFHILDYKQAGYSDNDIAKI